MGLFRYTSSQTRFTFNYGGPVYTLFENEGDYFFRDVWHHSHGVYIRRKYIIL